MKKPLALAAILTISFGVLAGCSSPSLITLKDGSEIQTVDKPVFNKKTGFYEYKQINGKEAAINKDDIITIKRL